MYYGTTNCDLLGPRLNILVCSEKAIKKYTYNEPHILISITSPGRRTPKLPESAQRKGVLYLRFHDVEDAPETEALRHKFENKHCLRIIKLIKEFPSIQTIIVNCEAGISRSAGVAAALSKYLTGDDSRYFKEYLPNRRVYRMLLNKLSGGQLTETPSSNPREKAMERLRKSKVRFLNDEIKEIPNPH